MRAAAIFSPAISPKQLTPFQKIARKQSPDQVHWQIGLPAAAEADVILIFGGDGTIHRHLARLKNLALPVLVVPAGSGNDFARAIGFRNVNDSRHAWRTFCAGKKNVRAIDLGVIALLDEAAEKRAAGASSPSPPHYFCTIAGAGLDAEVARRAQALPRWLRGHGGYALTLAPTLFRFAPLPMRILTRANGSWKARSDQPTLLAAFANAPAYGGGMHIAPQAGLDDGQLDVCVIRGMNPFKAACLFPTVYFGRHLKTRGVEYFQTTHGRLESEHPIDVYADGEYVCQTPVEISIQPAALRVITP